MGSANDNERRVDPSPPHQMSLLLPFPKSADAFQQSSDINPCPMPLGSSFILQKELDFKSEAFSQMLSGPLSGSSSPDASVTAQNGPASSPSRVEEGKSTSESPMQSSMTSLSEEAAAGNSQEMAPTTSSTPSGCVGRRSSVARFKSMMPSRLPISRSAYLTIPPGLSPTTLLDSPILLSMNQAEPSPTTGTFPLPPISQNCGKEFPASDGLQKGSNEGINTSFTFKYEPKIVVDPPSPRAKLDTSQLECESTMLSRALSVEPLSSVVPHLLPFSQELPKHAGSLPAVSNAPGPEATMSSERMSESPMKSKLIIQQSAFDNPPVVERPAEDGYNWRKYGQKHVKGSEFPRSYYKCTYPNCSVKKKVERSYDGHVTEIVYKGDHGHPKPQPTRRSSMNANGFGWEARVENYMNSAALKGHMGNASNGTPEASLGSNSEVEGDCELNKAKDEEPDSKRAREEMVGDVLLNMPLRTIREPRVIVQTLSEVDILDDGYRWRKYGQKVVKGNPYPRSYYKCTNVGCPVRKHVERSSANPGAVITTYEGKHNHVVPTARRSHHASSATSVPSNYNVNDTHARTDFPQDKYLARSTVQIPVLGVAPMNITNVVVNGERSSETLGQSLLCKPKEEQSEDNISATFLKSSSPHGITQHLAQGP